jgi:pyroglutamyl-peptidase
MIRVLITGFEPFGSETSNPSRELAHSFENEFDVMILPVSYERAMANLEARLKAKDYDFILMLGQAGGRKMVELERVALNLEDNDKADEDGDLRLQMPISAQGPAAYLSPLPLREMAARLQSRQLRVQVSLSAGAFVCNSLYYRATLWLKQNNKRTQALFVHVPFSREQVLNKENETAFMEISDMRLCVKALLEEIRSVVQ